MLTRRLAPTLHTGGQRGSKEEEAKGKTKRDEKGKRERERERERDIKFQVNRPLTAATDML